MIRWWRGWRTGELNFIMARSNRRKFLPWRMEEQFDEVLEELWVLGEHGEIAEWSAWRCTERCR